VHLPPLIADLAVILGVAALVTYVFRKISQPVVLGYLVAGFLLSPYTSNFGFISDVPNIQVLAELGIIFLMFHLGLEFSFRKLSRLGLAVILTGLFQVAAMVFIGFEIGSFLGWNALNSLFLGGMLAISSTTIIIKTLEELKLMSRRFAEYVFGILIIEDIVAILLLVLLTGAANAEKVEVGVIMNITAQLIFIVGTWFIIGYFLIPRVVKKFRNLGSDEMLTILSVGLCLLLVRLSASYEYSAALGAFIMGSILAETSEAHRIEKLLKPIRDIFAAVFFVSIGLLVNINILSSEWFLVVLVTFAVIFGKILSLTIGSLMTGINLRQSIQISFSMAQIGEFSFIIASLGERLNLTKPGLYPSIVAVSLITTFTTPYLVKLSELIVSRISPETEKRWNFEIRWFKVEKSHPLLAISQQFPRRMMTWLSCGILITLIFQLITIVAPKFIAPEALFYQIVQWRTVFWMLAMLLVSPFFWAMWASFTGINNSIESRLLILSSRALSAFWIFWQSRNYIGISLEFFLALAAILILYLNNRRLFEKIFHRFEEQFLISFKEKDLAESSINQDLAHLTPWDSRMLNFEVLATSQASGKTLIESKIRENFGFNIIAINRNNRNIVAPAGNERLLPTDKIIALGPNEQVDAIQNYLAPENLSSFQEELSYSLVTLKTSSDSPLVGKNIQESKIRENFSALVVGIERGEDRMVNPKSTEIIRAGDSLLVVVEKSHLRFLKKEVAGLGTLA